MKLIKKETPAKGLLSSAYEHTFGQVLDRRTFLRRSGLAVGGVALATGLPTAMMRRAKAAEKNAQKY